MISYGTELKRNEVMHRDTQANGIIQCGPGGGLGVQTEPPLSTEVLRVEIDSIFGPPGILNGTVVSSCKLKIFDGCYYYLVI